MSPRRRNRSGDEAVPNLDETGSILLVLPILTLGLFMMIGLIIDGAGRVAALQDAHAVAAQAARQAGQQIDGGSLQLDGQAHVNPSAGLAAARRYLRQSGMRGSARITGAGTQVQVTATTRYRPVFLSFFGIRPVDVTGSATSRLIQVGP